MVYQLLLGQTGLLELEIDNQTLYKWNQKYAIEIIGVITRNDSPVKFNSKHIFRWQKKAEILSWIWS